MIYTVGFVYPKEITRFFTHNFRCYLTLTDQNGKVVYLNWFVKIFDPKPYQQLLPELELYKNTEMQNLLKYVSTNSWGEISVYDTCTFNASHERFPSYLSIDGFDKFIFPSKDLYNHSRVELITSSACSSIIPDLLEGL